MARRFEPPVVMSWWKSGMSGKPSGCMPYACSRSPMSKNRARVKKMRDFSFPGSRGPKIGQAVLILPLITHDGESKTEGRLFTVFHCVDELHHVTISEKYRNLRSRKIVKRRGRVRRMHSKTEGGSIVDDKCRISYIWLFFTTKT